MKTAKRRNWRDEAPCLDVDPELFFPLGDERDEASALGQERLDEAKTFCLTAGPMGEPCPVLSDCLEDTLKVEGYVTWGVRGGTDRAERITILRRRAAARKAAAAEALEAELAELGVAS